MRHHLPKPPNFLINHPYNKLPNHITPHIDLITNLPQHLLKQFQLTLQNIAIKFTNINLISLCYLANSYYRNLSSTLYALLNYF
jgi:hypothetical protein